MECMCLVWTSHVCCLIWQKDKSCKLVLFFVVGCFFPPLNGLKAKAKKLNKYRSLTGLIVCFSQKNRYTKEINNCLSQAVTDVGQFTVSINFSSKLTWVLARCKTVSCFSIITSHMLLSPIFQAHLFHRNISRPRWIFCWAFSFYVFLNPLM